MAPNDPAPIDPATKPADPMGTLHLYLSTLQIHGDESTLSGIYDAWEAFQQAVTDAGDAWGGKAQVVVDPPPPPDPNAAPLDPAAPVPFQALQDRIVEAAKPATTSGTMGNTTSTTTSATSGLSGTSAGGTV